ncbi:MAG TPA: response regulator transcription factor [Chloroflexota bacterium]|nr:response regulator transcription factor [Chloroflexota bacterium]
MITPTDIPSNLPSTRHRVLVVENRCIVRQGLSTLIERFADLALVGQLSDSRSAVEQALENEADVIVLSVQSHDDPGLGSIPDLQRAYPSARVIVLGPTDEDAELVYQSVRAGALGYVSQDDEILDLVEAIRQVARGQAILAPRSLACLLETIASHELSPRQAPPHQLSEREQEVLRLVADGRSNREIAELLFLSESTVRSHIHNIFGKLQLTNRVQAARFVLDQHD